MIKGAAKTTTPRDDDLGQGAPPRAPPAASVHPADHTGDTRNTAGCSLPPTPWRMS
jgi:hypothetical protein